MNPTQTRNRIPLELDHQVTYIQGESKEAFPKYYGGSPHHRGDNVDSQQIEDEAEEKSDKSEKTDADPEDKENSEIIEQNNNEKDIKSYQTLDVKTYPEAGKIKTKSIYD